MALLCRLANKFGGPTCLDQSGTADLVMLKQVMESAVGVLPSEVTRHFAVKAGTT